MKQRLTRIGATVVVATMAVLAPQTALAAPATSKPSEQKSTETLWWEKSAGSRTADARVNFAKCDPSGNPTHADQVNANILNGQITKKMRGHMDAYRTSCARMIVNAVKGRGVHQRAAVLAIATAIVETGLKNYATAVDHDSIGLFQQRASWGSYNQRVDPTWSTNAFLNALFRKFANNRWMTTNPGDTCQAVQVSAFPDRYQHEVSDAQIMVNLLWGGTPHFISWGSDVRYRTAPSLSAQVGGVFSGPLSHAIDCQKRGDTVKLDGHTNDWWAHLKDRNGYVTNIYIDVPHSQLPGVPVCA